MTVSEGYIIKKIKDHTSQLAEIAQSVTGLENSGVDTTARAQLADITSTLTVENETWEVE